MTFDMSAWNTELALDIIEMLYTNSMDHMKPARTQHALRLFEMLVFLDHPQAYTFLLSLMVSALRTLDEIDGANVRCNKLDPVFLQNNLGMLYSSKGNLSKKSWEVSFFTHGFLFPPPPFL
jgi:hypothetical protein